MSERKSMLNTKNFPHIFFSQRLKIEKLFDAWCEEKHILRVPQSMVAYMQIRGWLNEDKIMEDLKEEGQNA